MAELPSPRETQRERLQVGPRPDEIAVHRFSFTLLGAHPGEVKGSLLELGAALDRARTALARETLEVRALAKALEAAMRETQELRSRLIATQAMLSALQDREGTAEGELPAAKESTVTVEAAKARAGEIAAAAEETAKATMQAARATALELLRSARTAAQTARRLADQGTMARPAGPRVGGDRLIGLFEELALELRGALSERDGGGAGTATRPGEAGDVVRAILTRISDVTTGSRTPSSSDARRC